MEATEAGDDGDTGLWGEEQRPRDKASSQARREGRDRIGSGVCVGDWDLKERRERDDGARVRVLK